VKGLKFSILLVLGFCLLASGCDRPLNRAGAPWSCAGENEIGLAENLPSNQLFPFNIAVSNFYSEEYVDQNGNKKARLTAYLRVWIADDENSVFKRKVKIGDQFTYDHYLFTVLDLGEGPANTPADGYLQPSGHLCLRVEDLGRSTTPGEVPTP
jgi:hypothetical protein